MIQPIETNYKGYRFRSRTEARWAVCFDALNVPWEYEKEGYDLGEAGWYLPDFWLPRERIWIEIKGDDPTEEERRRCFALADTSQHSTVLISGTPGYQEDPKLAGYYWPTFKAETYHGWHRPSETIFPFDYWVYGLVFLKDDLVQHLRRHGYEPPTPDGSREVNLQLVDLDRDYWRRKYGGEHPRWKHGYRAKDNQIELNALGHLQFGIAHGLVSPVVRALAAARAARFEHGETPR